MERPGARGGTACGRVGSAAVLLPFLPSGGAPERPPGPRGDALAAVSFRPPAGRWQALGPGESRLGSRSGHGAAPGARRLPSGLYALAVLGGHARGPAVPQKQVGKGWGKVGSGQS